MPKALSQSGEGELAALSSTKAAARDGGIRHFSNGTARMAVTSETELRAPEVAAPGGELLPRLVRSAEAVIVPLIALLAAAALFSLFLLILGKSPGAFFTLLWVGGFGTPFSWTNTLVRAGPLIFTALCVAIPARLGMVVIGGERALVLGGFSAAAGAIPLLGLAFPWLS